jgi:hypothetical protein
MRFASQVIPVLLVLVAIAAPVDAAPESSEESEAPVFYPPPPDRPRLQFLKKFSTAYDLGGSKSSFRDFVFGGEENEEKAVNKPLGVAVYDGKIFVVDTRSGGYVIFDLVENKRRLVRGSGAGTLSKPLNIAIDEQGMRFVTDSTVGAVLAFDNKDRFVRKYGDKDQFRPADVAVSGDRLYVSDPKNHKIHVLDKNSGESLFSFGGPGTIPGKLAHPTSLAISPDGTVYVSDTSNFRVQQFSADGEYIRHIGAVGTAVGHFARPKGVAVDRSRNLYVIDAAFQNVQVFNDEGQTLMFFGGAGNGPGDMNLPVVVKIDYDNVEYFRQYAAPGFEIEYLAIVVNQYGLNKVSVYGFLSEVD